MQTLGNNENGQNSDTDSDSGHTGIENGELQLQSLFSNTGKPKLIETGTQADIKRTNQLQQTETLSSSQSVQTKISNVSKCLQVNMKCNVQSQSSPTNPDWCKDQSTYSCASTQTNNCQHNILCMQFPEFEELVNNTKLHTFLEILHRYSQLNDFITLINSITEYKLLPTNIAWKCCLYHARWAMCNTTLALHFDHDYVEFFALLQIMFGSSLTNVLRGPGHLGKLVQEQVEWNAYFPISGDCNFAIP